MQELSQIKYKEVYPIRENDEQLEMVLLRNIRRICPCGRCDSVVSIYRMDDAADFFEDYKMRYFGQLNRFGVEREEGSVCILDIIYKVIRLKEEKIRQEVVNDLMEQKVVSS